MENSLLERERMDRMLEAGTVEEAAKVLTECGYPELQAVNVDTVDAMLAQAREELFGTLNDLAPNGEILDVFKVKYDYHNAKAMLKCEALGLDPEKPGELMYYQGTPETLSGGGWYHLVGRVAEGSSKPGDDEVLPAGWYDLAEGFSVGFKTECDLLPDDFPKPCFQMEFEHVMPWVLNEPNPYIYE